MADGAAEEVDGAGTAAVTEPEETSVSVSMSSGGLGRSVVPGEPPEHVQSELLWWLAARLYRDHRPGGTECEACHHPWPCSARRLAELGLIRAVP